MLHLVDNVGPNSHSHASKYPIWERIKKLQTAEKIAIAGLQVCSCGATYLGKFQDFQLGSGSLQVAGLQLWTYKICTSPPLVTSVNVLMLLAAQQSATRADSLPEQTGHWTHIWKVIPACPSSEGGSREEESMEAAYYEEAIMSILDRCRKPAQAENE